MINLEIIEQIEVTSNPKNEEEARAWLFNHLRNEYGRFCYKIEDVWTSNKPFDSIIDIGNNIKYFVEFKYHRNKKFDKEKIHEQIRKKIEPMQMITLQKLKSINSDLYVAVYILSTKTFILLKY